MRNPLQYIQCSPLRPCAKTKDTALLRGRSGPWIAGTASRRVRPRILPRPAAMGRACPPLVPPRPDATGEGSEHERRRKMPTMRPRATAASTWRVETAWRRARPLISPYPAAMGRCRPLVPPRPVATRKASEHERRKMPRIRSRATLVST